MTSYGTHPRLLPCAECGTAAELDCARDYGPPINDVIALCPECCSGEPGPQYHGDSIDDAIAGWNAKQEEAADAAR